MRALEGHLINGFVRKSERGFSLIIGMSVLILLTVLGIAAIQTVNADIDAAASDKGSQSALSVAEAGITWALDYLQTNYGLNTASQQTFQDIVNNAKGDFAPLSAATAEEKLACVLQVSGSPDACTGSTWQIMTHNRTTAEIAFGGGHFVVWVGLDPADSTGSTLLLRSLGIDARGSQRLIEIAVAAGTGQTL